MDQDNKRAPLNVPCIKAYLANFVAAVAFLHVPKSFPLVVTEMNKKLKVFFYCIVILVWTHWPGTKIYAQADSLLHIAKVDSTLETQQLIVQSRNLLIAGKVDTARVLAEKAYLIASRNNNAEGQADALVSLGKIDFRTGDNIQALYSFWQTIKLKSKFKDKGLAERVYYNMAVTFASMKQYPLALKYFQKANQARQRKSQRNIVFANGPTHYTTGDSTIQNHADTTLAGSAVALSWPDDLMHLLDSKGLVIDADTLYVRQKEGKRKEQKITEANILHSFDDGKDAIAYGLVIHTKQPVSGKRKSFSGINTVGHMFITLIKYNSDTEYTSRTFGFYPDKDNFLSATPIIPTSTATFKDDRTHDWDEIVAKFIPRRSFNKILRMVKKYSKTKYNLNKNNCTDFGLCVASVAGIQIKDTHGSWPLGSGNNPGFAGQSISDDKVQDDDHEDLLIIDAMKDNLQ